MGGSPRRERRPASAWTKRKGVSWNVSRVAGSGRVSHCIVGERRFEHCMTPSYSFATFSAKKEHVKEFQLHCYISSVGERVSTHRCTRQHRLERHRCAVGARAPQATVVGLWRMMGGRAWQKGRRCIGSRGSPARSANAPPGAPLQGQRSVLATSRPRWRVVSTS